MCARIYLLHFGLVVFGLCHARDNIRQRASRQDRSGPPELRNQQLAALAELSQSDAAGKIEAVFADKNEPHTMKRFRLNIVEFGISSNQRKSNA